MGSKGCLPGVTAPARTTLENTVGRAAALVGLLKGRSRSSGENSLHRQQWGREGVLEAAVVRLSQALRVSKGSGSREEGWRSGCKA